MKRLFATAGVLALLMGSTVSAETLKLVEVITSPERTETLQGMVDGFKAANPGVDVEIVSVPWGQAFETVATMIAGGDVPDVIEMPDTWQALYADQLMPLDDKIAGWEHGATLTGKTVDMGKLANGKMTMIPYGFYLRAMFYNKKLLAEAGVAAPPKTMDEFMAASEAVSKLDGKYGYCLRGGAGRHKRLDHDGRRDERQQRILHRRWQKPDQRAGFGRGYPVPDGHVSKGLCAEGFGQLGLQRDRRRVLFRHLRFP